MNDQNEKIKAMQARLVERQAEVLQTRIAACQAVADEFMAQAKFWAEQKDMSAVVAAYEDCAEKLEAALSIAHEGQAISVLEIDARARRELHRPKEARENFGCVQLPVELPVDAAAEADRMKDIATLIDAGVITYDESKTMATREKFNTGQWVVADDSDIVWRIGGIKTGMAFLESTEHPGWWCVLSKIRLASLAEILKTIQSNKAIIQAGGMVYEFGQPMHCKCDVQVNHAALPTIEEKYNNLKSLISIYFESMQHICDFGQASHQAFLKNKQIIARIKNIIREGV